jgi:hypothetical protein
MAVAVDSSSSGYIADVSSQSSFSLSAPTGSGGLLLLVVACGSGRSINTPSGWTAITGGAYTATDVRMASFYRTDNDAGPWTVSVSLTYSRCVGVAMRISGAAASSPTPATGTGSNDYGTLVGNALTGVTSNSLAIYAGSTTATTINKPSDTTYVVNSANDGTNGLTIASKTVTSDPGNDNFGTAGNPWATLTIAVPPASASIYTPYYWLLKGLGNV